jgi:hypothetical protein
MMPAPVADSPMVGVIESWRRGGLGGPLARPKSSTFDRPELVIMMLPGFRSR